MRRNNLKSNLGKSASLAFLSTFGIGGIAREVISVTSSEEIMEAVRGVGGKRFRVFARGSNIVFPDEGLEMPLIRVFGGEIDFDDGRIIADAGVPLAEVITFAIAMGLKGLETLSGIPGTIGGAVYGNAGAYGHAVAEAIEKVEVLIPKSKDPRPRIQDLGFERKWVSKAQCRFGYRESIFKKKDWIILRVILKLEKGDRKALLKKSQEIIAAREGKYKPGIMCPGSFFKNVLAKDVLKKSLALVDASKIIDGKIPAGWLLEQVGAKGMREGGIYIADFHGNLFVNDGKGTARDVKALARKLKGLVLKKFEIELEEEVRYF